MSKFITIIRPDFMLFCHDACKAATLNHLLFRIAGKSKDAPQEKIISGDILWYAKNEQIVEEMSNAWGLCKVRQEVNALISMGLVGCKKNPEWGADRTKHFCFGEKQCRKFLEYCDLHQLCVVHLELPHEVKHLIYSSNANDKSIKCICAIHQMELIDLSNANDKYIEAIPKEIPTEDRHTIEDYEEGDMATSFQEDRNAPIPIILEVEKKKRETNPRIPVPVLTVETKEQTVSSRIGSDTPVQHSGTPPGLLPPPGAGAAQGDRPPMALSAKEIGAQEKKREKELWVIFEEELGTKYSANQRKLQKDGIALLIADDISDETLHAGLQALNTFERRTFTVFKFYGWLPNLGAKRRQFKAVANGDIAPHQEDEDYSDFDIYKGNGKEERAAMLELYEVMKANGELIE